MSEHSGIIKRKLMAAISTIREMLDPRIIKNASTLYLSHFANMFLPLLTIPFLARVLGPEVWGIVIFIQAIGLYIDLAVDYGFEASATRDVARYRDDKNRLSEIAAGVLGARFVLAAGCLVVILGASLFVPLLRQESTLLWLGCFWFISQGNRPMWYFLGMETIGRYLTMEVIIKSFGVVGVFLLVRGPQDAVLVFLLQGGAMAAATGYGMIHMYRQIPFKFPTFSGSVDWLRRGWHMFVFYVSTSIYNMSNTLILGLVSAPINVSFYGGAERISRALVSIIYPLVQAVYPRSANLIVDDRQAAARLARLTIAIISLSSLVGAIVLYVLAPYLVLIVLGQGYEEVVPVLRVLLIVLPLIGISAPMINHWLMPLGLESLATRITLSAGVIHVPLAIFLGYTYAHVGIAWALVITETIITSVVVGYTLIRGIGPIRLERETPLAREPIPTLQGEKH